LLQLQQQQQRLALPLQPRPHRYNGGAVKQKLQWWRHICCFFLHVFMQSTSTFASHYCLIVQLRQNKQQAAANTRVSLPFVVYLDMDPKAALGRAPNGSSLIAANAITLDRHKEAFNKHHK